jgi:hypothetical protein
MTQSDFVRARVQTYFVEGEDNCAMTVLKILSEYFHLPLEGQVLAAAWYVPGAGGAGEVCGLVTGVLMFIGIWGAHHHYARMDVRHLAQQVSARVQRHYATVCCRDLRLETGCGSLAVDMLSDLLPVLIEGMAALQKD